ncbi:MAG: site-specific integrase, partial [Carnobacterium alterfunditum]
MNEVVEEYLRFLTIERGLSKNTIESYKRDISQYLAFISESKITEWSQIDR